MRSVVENKICRTIKYFGYGANASSDMMEVIIGRKPSGFIAWLEDYELWIQSWREISPSVRKILKNSWTLNFRTYCVSPKRGRKVKGYVWLLTPEERRLVSKWEFWYQPIKTRVRTQGGGLITAETEIVKRHSLHKSELDSERYKFFLNNKKQMLKIAKLSRGREEFKKYREK